MNLKEPKTQKILLGCFALIVGGYIYFGTSLLPFNSRCAGGSVARGRARARRRGGEGARWSAISPA
jgi:hypothetical protein